MAALATTKRFQRLAVFTLVAVTLTYLFHGGLLPAAPAWHFTSFKPSTYDWTQRPQAHPIPESDILPLPTESPRTLPRIQHRFSAEELTEAHNSTQRHRQDAVRFAAKRAWGAYQKYAWGHDELKPKTLTAVDNFGGWGATLVDSLDTLWIMGLKKEFAQAAKFVERIDWESTTAGELSLFETNIRFLGGLLAAYDLSGEEGLLKKALELGNMLYAAFDTPNHLPANSFKIRKAKEGLLVADRRESSAAVGTLSLEFTRLSQLTGDLKFFSVTDRIKRDFERTQDGTKLPGLWPVFLDLQNGFLTPGSSFTLGASADSAYEYLSKMHELLGGVDPAYEKMHVKAMETAKKHLLFSPKFRESEVAADILFSGNVNANGAGIIELEAEVQHLGCFTGGMFALGGKLFNRPEDVEIGEKLARGCGWAYAVMHTGVMPEVSDMIPCDGPDRLKPCKFGKDEKKPKGDDLPGPFAYLRDNQYLLRPEAIESIFILYRITGKKDLLEVAWNMFVSIEQATRTEFANSAISNVDVGGETGKINSMESFWLAETLKYFYLIFSDPDLISLDEYVFNTEAHPLRLPKPPRGDV
ncbi:Glycoside hydrolase [Rhypophila sp. PSN 637]